MAKAIFMMVLSSSGRVIGVLSDIPGVTGVGGAVKRKSRSYAGSAF
jgi:hypothetical protein